MTAVAIALLVVGHAAAQDLSPVRGAARVVSRVSYYSWDAARGWVELRDLQTVIEQFGPDRRILSRELRYGEKLLEATTYHYSPEGVMKLTVDEDNRPLRKAEVRSVAGRTIETVYGAVGDLLFSDVLRTDSAGRAIEVERRDASEASVYRMRYLYDVRGNLVESACLNPDGTVAFVSTFTYSDYNLRGAWKTCRETCSFADVKNRPRQIVRRTISAGGAE